MDGYLIKRDAIESMQGLAKTHFLNHKAQRTNKSLGDLTGLTGFGFHIIEVPPGALSTECHVHQFEDEAVYVLEGSATARIGDEQFQIGEGDFLGYRANGEPHTIENTGDDSPQVHRGGSKACPRCVGLSRPREALVQKPRAAMVDGRH